MASSNHIIMTCTFICRRLMSLFSRSMDLDMYALIELPGCITLTCDVTIHEGSQVHAWITVSELNNGDVNSFGPYSKQQTVSHLLWVSCQRHLEIR